MELMLPQPIFPLVLGDICPRGNDTAPSIIRDGLNSEMTDRYIAFLCPGRPVQGELNAHEIRLFTLPLREGQKVLVSAQAKGEIDLYVLDRFGLPVAFEMIYSNPSGRKPQAVFPALASAEYTLKLVSYAAHSLPYHLHVCAIEADED
jgi:hypothetical protein